MSEAPWLTRLRAELAELDARRLKLIDFLALRLHPEGMTDEQLALMEEQAALMRSLSQVLARRVALGDGRVIRSRSGFVALRDAEEVPNG